MAALFAQTRLIHKVAHYIPIYERVFGPYRLPGVRMCEIGVARGGSLTLWRRYFGEDSTIVGIDCDSLCMASHNPDRGIHVRIGDQADTGFLQSVIDDLGPFDIILDDGSHLPEPTFAAFKHLFAHGLKDGGVYLVEDLFTCYMHGPGSAPPTFVDALFELVDAMHEHYRVVQPQMPDAFQANSTVRAGSVTVPAITPLIAGVEVYDSIAVVRRGPRDLPRIILKNVP